MAHQITLTDEELREIDRILESELKVAMIEVRRSTPNSDFKKFAQQRVETLNHMLGAIRAEKNVTAA